jgi:hypothetical protein
MWCGRVLILVAVTASIDGCGSGGPAAPAPVDCTHGCWQPSAADEQFFTDVCMLNESCCVANEYRTASDVEGCKTSYRRAGVVRDASVRRACLDELETLASAGISCVPEIWNLSDPCVRVSYEPSGPQRPGGPCTTRADCAGAPGTITLCTRVSSQASPTSSVCLRLAPGKAGTNEPCLGDVMADGVVVAAARTVATSEIPISTGVYCERRQGLYCGHGNDPTAWACQAQTADGSSCETDLACASNHCLTSDGVAASFGHPGTCETRVHAGQTCDDSDSGAPPTLCDAATYCEEHDTAGTCMPKLPAASACSNDSMCLSDHCDDTHVCSTQTSDEQTALFGFCLRL